MSYIIKRALWFIGLYVVSLLSIGLIDYLLHWLVL